MTYRKIAALPLVWTALFVAIVLSVPPEARKGVFLAQNELSKGLATMGCFAAAYAFQRGDYMRRAWQFNAWCYLLLLSRDLSMNVLAPDSVFLGVNLVGIEGFGVFLANVASCIGTALLARAWSTAGLELPGTKASRVGMMLAGAIIAVAISGSDLLTDTRALFAGDVGAAHSVASDLGDIFGLALIAPVLLTAIAMRGGVLTWPWALLTASLVFWLLYDAVSVIEHFLPGHAAAARVVRETARALACATECAAGFAQRRVVAAPAAQDEAPA
jgi:hypothetical protein